MERYSECFSTVYDSILASYQETACNVNQTHTHLLQSKRNPFECKIVGCQFIKFFKIDWSLRLCVCVSVCAIITRGHGSRSYTTPALSLPASPPLSLSLLLSSFIFPSLPPSLPPFICSWHSPSVKLLVLVLSRAVQLSSLSEWVRLWPIHWPCNVGKPDLACRLVLLQAL